LAAAAAAAGQVLQAARVVQAAVVARIQLSAI
jgi:hypothetical protein